MTSIPKCCACSTATCTARSTGAAFSTAQAHEAQRYPGTQHGFHNDTTPRYDANAAAQAWQRALDFLNRNLRG